MHFGWDHDSFSKMCKLLFIFSSVLLFLAYCAVHLI